MTIREHGTVRAAWAQASESALLNRAIAFFGYLLLMILIMIVVGQKPAIPILIAAYLVRWGKYNWRFAISYAIGGWVFLVGFYDQILHIFWYSSWISSWLPPLLPTWFPQWLLF